MANEQRCSLCKHFSPALTCIERPTWGRCLRLLKAPLPGGPPDGKPVFTWADSICDSFQPRPQPVPRR